MPRVNIYIRNEDYEKWQAIDDKPAFMHEAINDLQYLKDRRERQLKQARGWKPKDAEAYKKKKAAYIRERRKKMAVVQAKDKARSVVSNAIALGKITKPESCMQCHAIEKVEAHHHDYEKPLEVVWVCRTCHELIHHPKVVIKDTI